MSYDLLRGTQEYVLQMTVARFLRSFTRFRRLQPQVGRVHSLVLRASQGRLRRSRVLAGGQPVLALTTTGRRSGTSRTTTLAYLRQGNGYVLTALNLGSDHHPAWCLNLRADPNALVYVEGERRAVRAREAKGEEAEALWRAYLDRLPSAADFRQLARRDVPMFVLDPVD
jgi:deazaflavin-dependent oxidoreductase (nitroreductase family)